MVVKIKNMIKKLVENQKSWLKINNLKLRPTVYRGMQFSTLALTEKIIV